MQWHPFFPPVEQIRRQAHGQIDGAWVIAGNAQTFRVAKFTQLYRTIAGQPIRRIIRFTGLQGVEPLNLRTGACQHLAARYQGQGGLFELIAITGGNHQQLAERIIGVGDHAQRWCRTLWQFNSGHGSTAHDDNNRMPLLRQLRQANREPRTTITGQCTKPGRDRTRRFQAAIVRAAGEHERQFQRTRITAVKERQRQPSQIVGQGNLRGFQLKLAGIADLGPQAGMQRVFTHHGVVTDQLKGQAVELSDQVRRYVHHLLLQSASSLLGNRQTCGHLIVDHHVDLRQIAEQRWRVAVFQVDPGFGHHLVGTHIETDAVTAFNTAQMHGVIGAQLLERGAVSRNKLRHKHFFD